MYMTIFDAALSRQFVTAWSYSYSKERPTPMQNKDCLLALQLLKLIAEQTESAETEIVRRAGSALDERSKGQAYARTRVRAGSDTATASKCWLALGI